MEDSKELVSNNNFSYKGDIRKELINFEQELKNVDGAYVGDNEVCPLKHSFSDGMYVREIFIPKGMVVVGKIHKHQHPNFLMKGTVDVVTEEGVERLVGPTSMISKAGTKRALRAITDLTWVTVHSNPTNTRDLEKLEKLVIAENYEGYEKFVALKGNWKTKIKGKIIKFLSE